MHSLKIYLHQRVIFIFLHARKLLTFAMLETNSEDSTAH